MSYDHVTLRSTAVFDLLAPHASAVPVQVELRYDTRDPYAVVAAFRTGKAGWVEWVFSRDLLADGLLADAGEGDVRIRPAADDPEIVIFELSSPSGHAVFETSAHRLADFLDRTYDIVVPGGESLWLNFDDAVEQLLSNDMRG
jgi:Streptomyces sporulation and cell division protein, SsgA